MQALVVGLAVTGEAVARHLTRRGHVVVAADDHPGDAIRAVAVGLGIELVGAPSVAELAGLVAAADVVLPSPGVPSSHPVFALAAERGIPVWSEFELAARWSDRPLVAITGTNGKTTVTTLVTEMLRRSGRATVAAGNTELPLLDALDEPVDVVVVEASSFRLQLAPSFHPRVGTWLNLAPDHLDWHASMAEYEQAKGRLWQAFGPGDTAVANADDPVVADRARQLSCDVVWFSLEQRAEWWWDRQRATLQGPTGTLVRVAALPRRAPHDLANALAAAATATAAGAPAELSAEVLEGFTGLAHRLALVADVDGVRWYDDSKATTPASVLAAVRGFDSVVLIAGGRNKGLDLGGLAATVPPVHHVVAIGDAADEVAAAFAGSGVPVRVATSMAEAVTAARQVAGAGDAVLLSPGCASFDWYRDYTERGADFARLVSGITGAPLLPPLPGGH